MDADETPIFDRAADKAEKDRAATHANTMSMLLAELEDVRWNKSDAAQAGSFALADIQQRALKRNRPALSPNERDAVLEALMRARENMVSLAGGPDLKRCNFALAAHEAACALVVMWGEQDPCKDRSRELIFELNARCRWLRNSLHNLSIEQQLRQRRTRRVQRAVDDLKAKALEARRA